MSMIVNSIKLFYNKYQLWIFIDIDIDCSYNYCIPYIK